MKTKNQNGSSMVKVIAFVCILAFSWPIAAHTQSEIDIPIPDGCEVGILPLPPQIPKQQILVCLPDPPVNFNGILVLYAHGYVNPQEPRSLPFEELANFKPVVSTIMEEGFAFG